MPKKCFSQDQENNILQDVMVLYKMLRKGKSRNSFKHDGTDG